MYACWRNSFLVEAVCVCWGRRERNKSKEERKERENEKEGEGVVRGSLRLLRDVLFLSNRFGLLMFLRMQKAILRRKVSRDPESQFYSVRKAPYFPLLEAKCRNEKLIPGLFYLL